MIKLVNVNKIYGSGDSAVHALKNVNLELPSGKFISIVGKSGSGKSTLMNIIGALDTISNKKDGSVVIDDYELTKLNRKELADYRNKKIGYIFQSFYLEPTFTVLENVAMPLTIAGMNKKKREEKAMEAIKKLNLQDKAKKKASELSGGQKQRVSIARALVANPDVILADEPTGNLDSQNGQEVIALLQEICDGGKTVVLVTHNIDDARKTDIMVEIKDGEIFSVVENSAEMKKKAQTASDYDKDGNLIADKEKAKLFGVRQSQVGTEEVEVAKENVVPQTPPQVKPVAKNNAPNMPQNRRPMPNGARPNARPNMPQNRRPMPNGARPVNRQENMAKRPNNEGKN